MIRGICREWGSEMAKELTQEGPRFFCESRDDYTLCREFDLDPSCSECEGKLQYTTLRDFSALTAGLSQRATRKRIIWKENKRRTGHSSQYGMTLVHRQAPHGFLCR